MDPEGKMMSSAHASLENDQELASTATSGQYQGNIHPLCGGNTYFSNPQYYIFAPTFLLSLVIVYVLNKHIFFYGWHFYIGKVICLYFIYRFLSLAFSDPGLARLRQQELPCDIGSQYRFCHICRLDMRKFTRHCSICEVCVEGYDHHCIFVGKCIGRGNMGEFKDFLCMAFSTLIYGLVISFYLASQTVKVGKTQ